MRKAVEGQIFPPEYGGYANGLSTSTGSGSAAGMASTAVKASGKEDDKMVRLTAASYVQSGNVIGNNMNLENPLNSVPQTRGYATLCELA